MRILSSLNIFLQGSAEVRRRRNSRLHFLRRVEKRDDVIAGIILNTRLKIYSLLQSTAHLLLMGKAIPV